MITELSPEQPRGQFLLHRACLCRCCSSSVCCSTAVVDAVNVIVCRTATFVAGSLNLMPVLSSSSSKRDILLIFPLAVLCRIYGFDLPTSSEITGMRGAKPGVSPPRRRPSYMSYAYMYTYFEVYVTNETTVGTQGMPVNSFEIMLYLLRKANMMSCFSPKVDRTLKVSKTRQLREMKVFSAQTWPSCISYVDYILYAYIL